MERPIYPLKNMRITQGYQEGTHMDSYAIDDAGLDTGIENVYAPFTGTIKKVYTKDANEIWLESDSPVEYPDGTIDYMTMLLAHDNDISDFYVGKKINQKEVFYQEGTAGNATGNHCHLECGRGKFVEPGWLPNQAGYYGIINGKKPEDCLWLESDTNIIDNHSYNFKTIPTSTEEEIEQLEAEDPPTNTVEPDEENIEDKPEESPRLIYTCKKAGLYGIYLKENEQVFLK